MENPIFLKTPETSTAPLCLKVREAEGRLGGQRERLEATRARLAAAATEGARLSADLELRTKEKVKIVVSLLSIGYSDL